MKFVIHDIATFQSIFDLLKSEDSVEITFMEDRIFLRNGILDNCAFFVCVMVAGQGALLETMHEDDGKQDRQVVCVSVPYLLRIFKNIRNLSDVVKINIEPRGIDILIVGMDELGREVSDFTLHTIDDGKVSTAVDFDGDCAVDDLFDQKYEISLPIGDKLETFVSRLNNGVGDEMQISLVQTTHTSQIMFQTHNEMSTSKVTLELGRPSITFGVPLAKFSSTYPRQQIKLLSDVCTIVCSRGHKRKLDSSVQIWPKEAVLLKLHDDLPLCIDVNNPAMRIRLGVYISPMVE